MTVACRSSDPVKVVGPYRSRCCRDATRLHRPLPVQSGRASGFDPQRMSVRVRSSGPRPIRDNGFHVQRQLHAPRSRAPQSISVNERIAQKSVTAAAVGPPCARPVVQAGCFQSRCKSEQRAFSAKFQAAPVRRRNRGLHLQFRKPLITAEKLALHDARTRSNPFPGSDRNRVVRCGPVSEGIV